MTVVVNPTSPETRLKILLDVISRVLGSPEPVYHTALLKAAKEATGLTEEEVAPEIWAAISACTFSGIFQSESFVERGDTLEFNVGSKTTLRPSKWATRFIWSDEYYGRPDDED